MGHMRFASAKGNIC